MNRRITDDMIFTTGVGNHQLLAAQYPRMKRPRSFLTSGSFGTMGFGMPVAVGAAHANPEHRVIVIDGDGSFRMNMGETHTIGTLDIPVKIPLLNNHSDGMVRNLEDVTREGRHSASERPRDVDFAATARECHFRFAERIRERADLAADGVRYHSLRGNARRAVEFVRRLTDRELVLPSELYVVCVALAVAGEDSRIIDLLERYAGLRKQLNAGDAEELVRYEAAALARTGDESRAGALERNSSARLCRQHEPQES